MSTTTLSSGRTTVTSAGTAVQLTATDTPVLWVTVTALTSNTSQINVGGSEVKAATGATERGIPLLAGDAVDFDVNNLTDVWIDSRVNGEGVTYVYGK
jgi:hypothetical protein